MNAVAQPEKRRLAILAWAFGSVFSTSSPGGSDLAWQSPGYPRKPTVRLVMGGMQGAADLQRLAGAPAWNYCSHRSLHPQHCGEEPSWERVFQGPAVLSSFGDEDLSSGSEFWLADPAREH